MFAIIATTLCVISCGDDEWSTNPEYEHIYYVGFYKSYVHSQQLQYNIAADGTAQWRYYVSASVQSAWEKTGTDGVSSNIPIDLHSQLKYQYDIIAYFYVANDEGSNLVAGTDYIVVDETGNTISSSDGKYALTWSQANKEKRKNIRIKRLTSATGVLKVNTLRTKPIITNDDFVETTSNNITNQYEVRGLSHDWNTQTVTFE
ncbi:hypothetical protein [Bacteroides sp. 519]|uniref:hypothetical protein n=1 Tax=Bacteroides sp. 519 TaxID=2302937 RepID=UPI0013D191A3|nr:hypothetical protein [Bacteroides sp. 519]